MIHDPTHIFFKLGRPVDHPVESSEPILPILYAHLVALKGFVLILGTNSGYRYKYRVASSGNLDAHDPQGECTRS
jgi:hypothetical protein